MSCVEKRHMSHRVGSMLHHRFPNGFTDLFMDETDREVSTLTDRAFRSLCVGDDAVYNDDFLYGYSPFSCHKPLVGEPLKKTKRHGQSKNDKSDTQPWKQQQKKNISQMSSFLKALTATGESCEGMLIKNGGMTDSNGESWDKSALRSIQRELSEFSSDYHTTLTDGHYRSQHGSNGRSSNKTSKDAGLPSGKSTKTKNNKASVKLRKLNIKNFFLHSEFSPFQTWTDFNRFPFGQEDTVPSILPADNIPKWYDLPFYKELTEAHRKDILEKEELQPCQKAAVEPSPPPPPSVSSPPKATPPPPPPKVLPKPSATQSEKRCTSEGGDVSAAPWRRNKSRAKSAVPSNLPGGLLQDNTSKTMEESPLLVKKEAKSVEVKAVEEVSSLASTPFSICQLMTPLIPSRQPTETSEILQGVFSPLALDLPLRPQSEAKVTPEPPIKRDSYKALASSILFNLKDNRKRVKSRYSPPKFKTLESLESCAPSPQSDHVKSVHGGSEGNASGLSTPAILKEGPAVFSPIVEPVSSPYVDLPKPEADKPLSDDYLLSNLLQTKKDALGEESPISPFMHAKKNKSPMAKKQNYPSLNLYKKANAVDSDASYLQVPLSVSSPVHKDSSPRVYEVSPRTLKQDLSPRVPLTNTGLSPNISNVLTDCSPARSPRVLEKEGQLGQSRAQNAPEETNWPIKDAKDKDSGVPVQSLLKEKETGGQTMSTMDVIRAAREAINAAKSKARSDSINKPVSEAKEQNAMDENASKEMFCSKGMSVWESLAAENSVLSHNKSESTLSGQNSVVRKDPPPVPKRNFAKSDIQFSLDKQQTNDDRDSNSDFGDAKTDLPSNENKSVTKQSKQKHLFSARQNNYIKNQRYALADDGGEDKEGDLNVNVAIETDDTAMSLKEVRDSEHIINDLLEKARLGDRVPKNVKHKLSAVNSEDEAKAKNDLISRELRNIKRGMLSMRGNTTSKREIFSKKEQEQRKHESFSRIDGNVIVNKALINDNYDKAKMALEEIISEREKRKCQSTEQDENSDGNVSEESYVTRIQQGKHSDTDSEASQKQNVDNPALKEKDFKDRLADLRDHNQIRQILSQTEPRIGETHRAGGRIALPGMEKKRPELDALLKSKPKSVNPSYDTVRQTSEESREEMSESDSKKTAAPPVPPRSKKGGRSSDMSITAESDAGDEDVAHKTPKHEDSGVNVSNTWAISGIQEAQSEEAAPSQTEISSYPDTWNVINHLKSDQAGLNSSYTQSENSPCLSPEIRTSDGRVNTFQIYSPTSETSSENSSTKVQETYKVKRKAPLRPDHPAMTENILQTSVADEQNKISRTSEDMTEGEAVSEAPRHIISPLLLVNGLSINQSPPDQASLSSKSSYFSVESALQRNMETESNVYHSLENLTGELEQADDAVRNASQNTKRDSERTELEYYSLSDHESESEAARRQVKSPQKEPEAPQIDSRDRDGQSLAHDENTSTVTSLSNTFSPPLGIPALFKVKDNTFTNKLKKTMQPWSPRGSLSGAERLGELESHQVKENPEFLLVPENPSSTSTLIPTEIIIAPEEIIPNPIPPLLPSPSHQQEDIKNPYFGNLLTVPQEEDRSSGVSPLSDGVESLTTSAADTADEMVTGVTKVLSERSGSTCSGSSQTGPVKPPAVLPKSEKAVLKAIKLANRRMKKEEAHKSSQKSSQSSSKHRSDKQKSDKSEHKSSSSSGKSSRSSEKKHREKTEGSRHHGESHRNEQVLSDEDSRQQKLAEMIGKPRRQSYDSVTSGGRRGEGLLGVASERQGRSSDRHVRDKPESRHYSSDRIISNVPVYKAQVGDRTPSDRPFHRTQSIDRYMGDKPERRLSADIPVNETLDPRAQRIEKSIKEEFQQRGRARDKASRENPLRRSHSIDAYSTEAPHPSSLSRQSSYTSQLSRQSSIEHAIMQSFPLTQRKILQDPDSGQYFFVDMPVQVKTKTFFDPETGSYLQLPVQPPEGAVPQALSPPMVLYRGFVPVPLSPMAQKAPVQAPCTAANEFEQRHLERSRQMHCKEGQPYLEPVYAQHDLMLGEFMGTEELDCPR